MKRETSRDVSRKADNSGAESVQEKCSELLKTVGQSYTTAIGNCLRKFSLSIIQIFRFAVLAKNILAA